MEKYDKIIINNTATTTNKHTLVVWANAPKGREKRKQSNIFNQQLDTEGNE